MRQKEGHVTKRLDCESPTDRIPEGYNKETIKEPLFLGSRKPSESQTA